MSYDTDVVAATSGRGDEADWDKIIRLCDRIRESFGPSSMGSALAAVMRRIKHPTPNIQSQALTLLEACVSNCGKDFQLELTKSTFQTQAKELITARSIAPASIQRFKTLLVSWSREYRNDTQMSGFCRFVDQLVNEGSIMVQAQPGSSSSSYATPSMYSSISPPQHQRDQPRQEDDLQKGQLKN
jgi:signal transducing adaptor molecule